jgi:phosphoglucosamine mutase
VKQLFGTDGIRGVAGKYPLDPKTVTRFGSALAEVLFDGAKGDARVALGRDTRESGDWIATAVASGLSACGVEVVDAGVITTPGLAHVLRIGGFGAGVMISASHNPFADNGLKVFGAGGFKISDELEQQVEQKILSAEWSPPTREPQPPANDPELSAGYLRHLEAVLSAGRLDGLNLVLDCANGSASALAQELFQHYGAAVTMIGNAPDGRNINLGCGSLHLESLGETVRQQQADIGVAFDGDADRCLAVDSRGRPVDGDYILYIIGRRLKRQERLPGAGIVATIMSNLWLERKLSAEGVKLERAPVGDKYVLEQMTASGLTLGGEQSGHIIFREHATTGDGMLTALMLLDALVDENRTLDEVFDEIEPCPQVQINVRVREKPDLRRHPEVGPAVSLVERTMADSGRVVLRYSGTEPVARIMVEGTDAAAVKHQAEQLAGVVERAIGEG